MKNTARTSIMALIVTASAMALADPPVITEQVTPGTMSYQGRLQTSDGVDYTNGVYTVDFKLYDAASAGTFLWGATYKPYVNNGFFSVILGQTSVGEVAIEGAQYPAVEDFWKGLWIDPNAASKQRFLGITVHENENNEEITELQESFPRQELLASPFAIQAQYAQQASGDFSVPGDLDVTGGIANSGGDLQVADNVNLQDNLVVGNKITAGNYTRTFPAEEPTPGDIVAGDDIFANYDIHVGRDVFVGDDIVMKHGTAAEHNVDHIVEGSQSKMRIITGLVDADGSIERGHNQGFTCSRIEEGVYQVNLTGLSHLISVTASPTMTATSGAGLDNFIFTKSFSANGFVVESRDDHPDEFAPLQDAPFCFIAIGHE